MKKENGITLVALVISIIVLLILATVSINLVINNGILDKAKYATEIYSIEQLREQLYLKALGNDEEIVTGKLSDLDLNISQDFIDSYDDILFVKDGKLYLSFITAFPNSPIYQSNKDKIEKLKNSLEINYESIKNYNMVVNPSFDDGLNGYSIKNTFNNVIEVLNENGNKYVHMDMEYVEGGRTTYINQRIINAANAYNDKLYINAKFRNSYASSRENLVINNNIIQVYKNESGYNESLLNPNKYIEKYNAGWTNVSLIRIVSEQHNSLNVSIALGGELASSSSWEYTIDFDDVYIINLTEIFGAGNEPTQEEMDKIFNNF